MRFALIAVVSLALLGAHQTLRNECRPDRHARTRPSLPSPPPDLAGQYLVTFVAADCEPSSPAELRTRTYAARLEQNGARRRHRSDRTDALHRLSDARPRLWGQILPDRVDADAIITGMTSGTLMADRVSPAECSRHFRRAKDG